MKRMDKENIRTLIREELYFMLKNDKFVFSLPMQILDGRNLQLGKGTGTIIGTESTQRLGFWGKSPVVQQASIADPAGAGDAGVDQPARDAVNSILDVLDAVGFTA